MYALPQEALESETGAKSLEGRSQVQIQLQIWGRLGEMVRIRRKKWDSFSHVKCNILSRWGANATGRAGLKHCPDR